MKTVWRLLRFLKPFAGWVAISVLLGAAAVGSAVGLLGTSAYLIARAALQPSIAVLQVPIVAVRFFGLSRACFRYLERLVSHSVNFRLLARLRTWFYMSLEPLAPARLLTYESGDLLGRAVGDIEMLENFYVRVVSPPLVAGLITVGASVFVGSLDTQLGWILALGLAGGGLLVPLLAYMLGRHPGRRFVLARARLNATVVSNIQGMGDLIAFGCEKEASEKFERLSRETETAQHRAAWVGGITVALYWLVTQATLLMALLVSIPLVRREALDGVLLAVVCLLVLSSFEGVQPLGLAAQYLESSLQAARRLFDLVDVAPCVSDLQFGAQIASPPSLLVRDLTFSYAPHLPLALDGVSFELPPGKKLALVGPSGAGKTTLVHILLRFWEQQSGQVFLGSEDTRKLKMADVRRQFGVLQQNAYLFTDTLRGNLLLANPGADEKKLREALDKVQLGSWLASLPHGLDTWMGEGGQQMSGGERQRLAAARLLLQDAPIFVLDEPTANLDAITAKKLMEMLLAICEGRSLLWITHHLSGLHQVDEVLVLQAGRVVERGQHDDLLKLGGLYARLWWLQNRQVF
ncbi:MAG: thiol reductant ABC exporter subunit CydC [Anaerolineae bacterium]|nr:thiol reductant ABC exporter subunit CydC [Anaerolineae bacterium]